ncbi:carotenoid 1,2-hydratase [bacterium]|nr:carotenoid 1,2-hydratase [bacterium]
MKEWIPLILISLIISGAGVYYWIDNTKQPTEYANITQVMSENPGAEQFERAVHPRAFVFPRDLGSHNRFQTEWWYFTGNLTTAEGRPFGYQLTFFRRAIRAERPAGQSAWATNQLYMAHFALSDIQSKSFLTFERFSRGSLGLAGAEAHPFKVWLENWAVSENRQGEWMMSAQSSKMSLQLTLRLLKPMVFNGRDGLSQKGPEPGNASYYFSNTRIESTGTVIVDGKTYPVSGYSWLDREWSSSALSQNQTGWDWFSIQLDDWREIMLYQIREKNGSISQFSSGSFVNKDGSIVPLQKNDFQITVVDRWRSPVSGQDYPAAWIIRIPLKGLLFSVKPLMKNQEHRHSFAYWEGAVVVEGEGLSGKGYVELTGYTSNP